MSKQDVLNEYLKIQNLHYFKLFFKLYHIKSFEMSTRV